MAILSREDFFSKLQARIGQDTSDEAIQLLEDMTDTYNDLVNKGSNSDTEDWKARYEENDKMWREKYRDRFFSGSTDAEPLPEPPVPEKSEEETRAETITVNDLFTTADKKE